MIEILVMIAAAFVLAFGASKIDATPNEKEFTWPKITQTGDVSMNRYQIVCKSPRGELLFTAHGFVTEAEAQQVADEFNSRATTENTWSVEPIYYN